MVFFKIVIQKTERNKTKQNRTKIVRKQTKIATYVENMPTKKKKQKYPKNSQYLNQEEARSIKKQTNK